MNDSGIPSPAPSLRAVPDLLDVRDGFAAEAPPGKAPVPTAAEHARALAEVERLTEAVDNLKVALETNREIGAAVGILMATEQLSYAQAFNRLRSESQSRHAKLRALAQQVIETGMLGPAAGTDRPTANGRVPPRRLQTR